MFKCGLVLCLAALAFGLPADKPESRIIGGGAGKIKDYPFVASLIVNHEHVCGCAIIDVKFVLTSAQCVEGINPEDLSVRAGSENHNSGGVVEGVKHIFSHPRFNHKNLDYDLAIVELENPLKLSQSINFVDLPVPNFQIPEGTQVTAMGWGSIGNDVMPALLQQVRVSVISQVKCKTFYAGKLTARMLCAGNLLGGKDICDGDNGGPLITNDRTLVGIASWHSCGAANAPGVFTSVATVRDFISTVTGIV